jgi:hypothetical protein
MSVGNILIRALADKLSPADKIALIDAFQGSPINRNRITIGSILLDTQEGITIYHPSGARAIYLAPIGSAYFGRDIDDPAKTSLIIFSEGERYNQENVEAGDVMLGDNSSGRANLFWDRSTGKLEFRGGTTVQAYVDTDGSIKAGVGIVTLDEDGITIEAGTSYADQNLIDFKDSAGTKFGYVGCKTGATLNEMRIWLKEEDKATKLDVQARANATKQSLITIQSLSGSAVAYMTLSADSDAAEPSSIVLYADYVRVVGELYTKPWTDYSGDSTIIGFASYTAKKLRYKTSGDLVFVQFHIEGPYNGTTVSFTLPDSAADVNATNTIRTQDNGTLDIGFVNLIPSTSVVNCYRNASGAAWTASGTRRIQGELFFQRIPPV